MPNAKNRQPRKKNKTKRNKAKSRAKVIKQTIEYKKQKGCSFCAEKRPQCLEFHHNNDEKEIRIAARAARGSLAIEDLESKGVLVVCKNCHADMEFKKVKYRKLHRS